MQQGGLGSAKLRRPKRLVREMVAGVATGERSADGGALDATFEIANLDSECEARMKSTYWRTRHYVHREFATEGIEMDADSLKGAMLGMVNAYSVTLLALFTALISLTLSVPTEIGIKSGDPIRVACHHTMLVLHIIGLCGGVKAMYGMSSWASDIYMVPAPLLSDFITAGPGAGEYTKEPAELTGLCMFPFMLSLVPWSYLLYDEIAWCALHPALAQSRTQLSVLAAVADTKICIPMALLQHVH